MTGAHTGAALNIISKSDLVKLIVNTEVNMGSQTANLITEVTDILNHSKKLETDVAIVNYFNNTLIERVVTTECHCWGNA